MGSGAGRQSGAQASRALRRTKKVLPAERPGFLWRSQVGPVSAARYEKASSDFRLWASLRHARISTLEELDSALERYFESLYFDGLQVHVGRQTLYGEAFVRQESFRAADRMTRAKGALKGWAKKAAQASRDPMPWLAAVLLILALLARRTAAAVEAAAGLYVQFDGYLRPSELLDLTVRDVVLPKTSAGPTYRLTAVIVRQSGDPESARPAKSGEFDCTVPFPFHKTRSASSAILSALVLRAKRNTRQALFPHLTLARYELAVSKSAASQKLDALRLTPHMARHGGPSEDSLSRCRSLPEIQQRGRWEHAKSVARYRKAGTLLRQIRLMSGSQLRMARTACPDLGNLVCSALREI